MKHIILAMLVVGMIIFAGCVGGSWDADINKIIKTGKATGNGSMQKYSLAHEEEGENAIIIPGAGEEEDSVEVDEGNNYEVEEMEKNPIVVFETDKGTFKAEIFVNEAPITGGNFMELVRSEFYDGLTFHRVEPNFVVQGGDPKGDGTGGSNKTIPLEVKENLKHETGSLAMARSQNSDSASSQFYIVIGPASFLDGQYAVFGKVKGNEMEVVNKIKIGDKMNKVYEEK
ncbi:MAG: peptidylprolyl isomerase [Candidatus Micrarchaeota archaeon]